MTRFLAALPLIAMLPLCAHAQQTTAAQNKVDARAKKDWFKQTKCRSLYSMADCFGYKAKPAATGTTGASGAAGATGATG